MNHIADDVVWGRTAREHRSQVIDVTRPFGVVAGRWGFDPAIQGVALGNLDAALRGRGK